MTLLGINKHVIMVCTVKKWCDEFNDYLEKLSKMNGNIVIVGDFNIDWLNTNGSDIYYDICKGYFQKKIRTVRTKGH